VDQPELPFPQDDQFEVSTIVAARTTGGELSRIPYFHGRRVVDLDLPDWNPS
jgi:hypothetical protein